MQIELPLGIEEIQEVNFRELVPEIPNTNYATHGIYYYPARFIPQVVRFALEKWTHEGEWVIDPFAGAGTVAVESVLLRRNAFVVDLNPLLEPLLRAKIPICPNTGRPARIPSWTELYAKAERILKSKTLYRPCWSRISYWHPPEFLDALAKMWGEYRKEPEPHILPALLKTTRKFSYADDQVPKLFRSRRKTREVIEMLKENWRAKTEEFFFKELKNDYERILEFKRFLPQNPGSYTAVSGVDSLTWEGPNNLEASLLLTSPPYGIAHEYIRSVKLELAWLGFSDKEITSLINHEIPYNKPPNVKVESPVYQTIESQIPPELRKFYHAYFKSVCAVLERFAKYVKKGGRLCLFVGEASFGGFPIPIHHILRQHFGRKGWEFETAFSDAIKARKLFRGRKNPSPNGIPREILLVLRKA